MWTPLARISAMTVGQRFGGRLALVVDGEQAEVVLAVREVEQPPVDVVGATTR